MRLARPRRRQAFMGLTPLIDMIFLLLLFFLLGSDFVTFGQSRLAPPRGSGGQESASQPVIVSLAESGALTLNSVALNAEELARQAAQKIAVDPEQVFVVMPAGAANVHMVSDSLDVLVGVGAAAITLERDVFDIDLNDF